MPYNKVSKKRHTWYLKGMHSTMAFVFGKGTSMPSITHCNQLDNFQTLISIVCKTHNQNMITFPLFFVLVLLQHCKAPKKKTFSMYLMGACYQEKNCFQTIKHFEKWNVSFYFLCFLMIPNGFPLGIMGKNEENDYTNVLHMVMPSKWWVFT